MTKFLNKWLRKIHRWIAIPTALLIPVRLIFEAMNNQAILDLWAKWEKLPSILMLFMAITGSYLYLLPYIVKGQRKRTTKKESPSDSSIKRNGADKMKNQNTFNRIASILAFIIGLIAVFAGGKVLLGILPDYYVIDWLPIYNFAMGAISALFSSIVIWKNGRIAMPVAIGTFGLHAVVMLILQTAYHDVVALDSIVAMTVRLVVWAVIAGLLIVQKQIKKESL